MVDSTDRERVGETRQELKNILQDDRMSKTTLLVFSNKVDLPGSASTAEIIEKLGLDEHRERDWFIQATCGVTGVGLMEGLEWLADSLEKKE